MKKFFLLSVIGAMLAGCGAKASHPQYVIDVDAEGFSDGDIVYLVDFDTREPVDSAAVTDGKLQFVGEVDKPFVGRLTTGGRPFAQLIVESGNITVDEGGATGTKLNDRYNADSEKISAIVAEYNAAPNDSARMAVLARYDELTDKIMRDNIDNPIGYMIFVERSTEMDRDEFDAILKDYPQLKDYKRVQSAMQVFESKDATAPGKMFTDLEIEYDGKVQRLSDYVGKGNYTLVDFWASWCGPCRRESKVVKELYEKYAPEGLEVVGVAVWDKPEDTLAAIEQLKLPWKQIINGQTEHTDRYGILGIPCIILFAPDGTIVARDLQGDALRDAVSAAFPL